MVVECKNTFPDLSTLSDYRAWLSRSIRAYVKYKSLLKDSVI